MYVEPHAAVDGADHAVAVPRLRLYEQAVRKPPFAERVARGVGVDEPVVVILVALGGDEVAVLVFRPAFVGVGAEDVGVGLAPNVVLDRVADEYGREVGQRKSFR